MKFRIYSSSFGATMLGILGGMFIAVGVLGALSGAIGLLLLAVAGVFIDIVADKLADKKDLEKIKKNVKYAYDRFLQQKTLQTKSSILRMNPGIQERVKQELPTHWVCDRCLALNEKSAGNRCRDCNTPIGYSTIVATPVSPPSAIRKEPVEVRTVSAAETPKYVPTETRAVPVAEALRYAPAEKNDETAAKPRLKSTMNRQQ